MPERRARRALALAFTVAAIAGLSGVVPTGFTDDLLVTLGSPTALAFTPDGRLLIATQAGRLRIYQNNALLSGAAIDLGAILCRNRERGLLGVAVDPAFSTNGYIYLFYTFKGQADCDGPVVNRVSRFVLSGNTVNPASELVLVDNIPSPSGYHNGGDLQFGKDGFLYISIGDGASTGAARNEHVLAGKILRITGAGGIPASNPFQGADSARCNVTGQTDPGKKCQETFAWGLRNPFRMAFDPNDAGTRFFINDVGQNAWEEIDLGQAGADYGWNVREGFCVNGSTTDCGPPPAGMTNPIFAYGRSDGCTAITGGAFVPNGLWPAQYEGAYLFSDYTCGTIFTLTPNGAGGYTRAPFATALGVNSAVAMVFGPYAGSQALYYTTYADGGQIRRIVHTGSANRAPTASASGTPTSGPVPLTVTFSSSGSSDPDGDPLSFEWNFADGSPVSTSAAPTHTYAVGGQYNAVLTVRDNRGGSGTATVPLTAGNSAPTPSISSPTAAYRFRVGETITLQGSASDPEDGTLPASSLSWIVILHHNTHTHPFFPSTGGNNLTLTTPPPEDLAAAANSYLEIQLTATDSAGLSGTVTQDLRPRLVDVTFTTTPAGLALLVNGASLAAPRTVTSWHGYALAVDAPAQADSAGQAWAFVSWSDGGAAEHTIVTPASAASYAASFTGAPSVITRRYLAEGATGPFFDTRLALVNPGSAAVDATLQFERDDGVVVAHTLALPGRTRRTVWPRTIAGLESATFATLLESTGPLVVDRTMTWSQTAYGSHSETSLAAPATTWYLAEGSTSDPFALFYLVQNPNSTPATVTITYLRPAPATPLEKVYVVAPTSRFNIPVDDETFPDASGQRLLAGTDVSAKLTSTLPIVVERAMYLSREGQPFAAGHSSGGVTGPAPSWFLAEGATGSFFDLFILIANPEPTAAAIEARYSTTEGVVLTKNYTVAPNSRQTIWVDDETFAGQGKALADVSVSTTITSTNGVPIIVERSMWWPEGMWYEAHNSPGATATATRWGLAEGQAGGAGDTQTYILIANTSPAAGDVQVTLLFEDGPPATKTFTVEANRRFNVSVAGEFGEAVGRRFGAIVESVGASPVQIVVERAMYSNAEGLLWAAGSNTLGTRLP